jgi:hypothetical protein
VSVEVVNNVYESVSAIAACGSCEELASESVVKDVNEVTLEIAACDSSEESVAVVDRASESEIVISAVDGITLLRVFDRVAGAVGMHIELAQWGDLAAACRGVTCLRKFPAGSLPRPPEELGCRQKSGLCLQDTMSDTSTIAPFANDVMQEIEGLEDKKGDDSGDEEDCVVGSSGDSDEDTQAVQAKLVDEQVLAAVKTELSDRFGNNFIKLEPLRYDGKLEIVACFRKRGFGRRWREAIALAGNVFDNFGVSDSVDFFGEFV